MPQDPDMRARRGSPPGGNLGTPHAARASGNGDGLSDDTILVSGTGATACPGGGAAAEPEGRLGPFVLEKEIGRGGQGVVYVALDTRLSRRVALKVLPAAFTADARQKLRFEREAGLAARLHHPGICTVYEAGTIDGVPCIAMRLLEGETLAERIRRWRDEATAAGEPLPDALRNRSDLLAATDMVRQAATALHVAHGAGLIHRDIKPGNIMIEPPAHAVILDFGLARERTSDDVSLTGTGTFLGTPAYASPEQAAAAADIDHRTDIWSLGVTLYELCTGRRPFQGNTLEALLRAIRTAEPEDPRRINPAIPRDLAAVILMAIEKDRGRRYQDAGLLAADLESVRTRRPVSARRITAFRRFARAAARNPVVTASVALALLGLAAGLVFSLVSLGRTRDALRREGQALDLVRDHRGRAEDLLAFMLGDLKDRLKAVGRLDILGTVARRAGDYFETRPPDPARPEEVRQHAAALRNLGEILSAEGDQEAALAHHRSALRIAEGLVLARPGDAAARRDLVSILSAIAAAEMVAGRRTEAVATAGRSLALRRELLAAVPANIEHERLVAAGLVMLGNTLNAARRPRESLPAYEEAVALWRGLVERDPAPAWRRELAVTLQNFAEARRLDGDPGSALALRREGLGIFRSLAAAEPENREWIEQLATGSHGIALALRGLSDPVAATAASEEAVTLFRRLLREDPENSRRLFQLGHALNVLGVLHEDADRVDAALGAFDEAAARRRRLSEIDPKNRAWRLDLHHAEGARARVLADLGRGEESAAAAAAATAEARHLAAAGSPEDISRLAGALLSEAAFAREQGRTDAAAALASESIRAGLDALKGGAADPRQTDTYLKTARRAAPLLRDGGRPEEARRALAAAVDAARRMTGGSRASALPPLPVALLALGELEAACHRFAEAARPFHEAIECIEEAARAATDPAARTALAEEAAAARLRLAEALWRAGRTRDASEIARGIGDAEGSEDTRDGFRTLRTALDALTGLVAGKEARTTTDLALLAVHHLDAGRTNEALAAFHSLLPRLDAEPVSTPLPRRALLLEGARAAALHLARSPAADLSAEIRSRAEKVAIESLAAALRILDAALREIDRRLAESKPDAGMRAALRERRGDLRAAADHIRHHDPDLAPLRGLPALASLLGN